MGIFEKFSDFRKFWGIFEKIRTFLKIKDKLHDVFGPPGAIFEKNISLIGLFGPPGAIFEKKQQPAKPRRAFFDFRKWL